MLLPKSIYHVLISFPSSGEGGLIRLRRRALIYQLKAAIPAIRLIPPRNPPTVPPTATDRDTVPSSIPVPAAAVGEGEFVSFGSVRANVATLIL